MCYIIIMIDRIRFIIPNLDRRSDRWERCVTSLHARNVPPENIQRFASVDGLDFLNKTEDHMDLTLIDRYMERRLGSTLPPFLANYKPTAITAYAWKCTWLLAVTSVLNLADHELGCVMIDDTIIAVDYPELLDLANSIVAVCTQNNTPFLVAELSQGQGDRTSHPTVPECPTFQEGFARACDCGILYSPAGAHLALQLSNNIEGGHCDPQHVSHSIKMMGRHPGIFGISAFGSHPDGIVLVDMDVHLLNLYNYNPDATDNGYSNWFMEEQRKT